MNQLLQSGTSISSSLLIVSRGVYIRISNSSNAKMRSSSSMVVAPLLLLSQQPTICYSRPWVVEKSLGGNVHNRAGAFIPSSKLTSSATKSLPVLPAHEPQQLLLPHVPKRQSSVLSHKSMHNIVNIARKPTSLRMMSGNAGGGSGVVDGIMSLLPSQFGFGETIGITVVGGLAFGYVKYRSAINKRLDELMNDPFFGEMTKTPFRMVRMKEEKDINENTKDQYKTNVPNKMTFIDLNMDYINNISSKDTKWKHFQYTSLGQYFSSVRPNIIMGRQMPEFIENELQNALAAALLKGLGPQFGTAILPALGLGQVKSTVDRVVSGATKYFLKDAKSEADADVPTKTLNHVNGDNPQDSTNTLTKQDDKTVNNDAGALPLSLFAITYLAEANYQRFRQLDNPNEEDLLKIMMRNNGYQDKTPLDMLSDGEVGFNPSYYDSIHPTTNKPLVPNPFVFNKDWDEALDGMEQLLKNSSSDECEWKSNALEAYSTPEEEKERQKTNGWDTPSEVKPPPNKGEGNCYNRNGRQMKPPTPIDERFLPDLCIGWGNAICSHTEREILQNRLLCVLLNKLAANYCSMADAVPSKQGTTSNGENLFRVQLSDGRLTTKPSELIKDIAQNMGHTVEACVRSQPTTFGVALCVKEADDQYTNIPISVFLQNGMTSSSGQDAYLAMPHSGLDLEISGDGPLFKNTPNGKLSIQHFIGPEGLCGWYSNHHALVPWIQPQECGPVMKGPSDASKACEMAGLEAAVMTCVGTDEDLPLGGYGLTGVCNDSSALLEYSLHGKTNIYPITLNGRFAMTTLRAARNIQKRLQEKHGKTDVDDMSSDLKALDSMIGALMELKSDINSLPSERYDQIQRQLNCLPPDGYEPFKVMKETKQVLKELLEELPADKEPPAVADGGSFHKETEIEPAIQHETHNGVTLTRR